MSEPIFQVIETELGRGVTYDCGCPCTPTAVLSVNEVGSEHCCCGKVHFAGAGAATAMDAYLAERKATRTREPEYTRGAGTIEVDGAAVEVAWAFPVD
ncbi:hypothetical protein J0H33_04815 [bacterium]|nr:hypothetical protein [bacterium]